MEGGFLRLAYGGGGHQHNFVPSVAFFGRRRRQQIGARFASIARCRRCLRVVASRGKRRKMEGAERIKNALL